MRERPVRLGQRLAEELVSRPAAVRAAATETCWPRIARTASSEPSTVPGTRSPGAARTSGASSASCAEVLNGRRRVGVEVEQPPAALNRRGQVAQVGEVQLALPCAARAPWPELSARRSRDRAGGAACGGRRHRAPPRRRDRAVGEEAQQPLPVQRLAEGEAHRQDPGPSRRRSARDADPLWRRCDAAPSACARRPRGSCR